MLIYYLNYNNKTICQTMISFEGGFDVSNIRIDTRFDMVAYTELIIKKIRSNEEIETFITQVNNIDKLKERMYRKIITEAKYIDVNQIYKQIENTYKLATKNCNWLECGSCKLKI